MLVCIFVCFRFYSFKWFLYICVYVVWYIGHGGWGRLPYHAPATFPHFSYNSLLFKQLNTTKIYWTFIKCQEMAMPSIRFPMPNICELSWQLPLIYTEYIIKDQVLWILPTTYISGLITSQHCYCHHSISSLHLLVYTAVIASHIFS